MSCDSISNLFLVLAHKNVLQPMPGLCIEKQKEYQSSEEQIGALVCVCIKETQIFPLVLSGAQFTDARSSTSEYTDQNNVLPLSVTRAAERAGAEQQPPLRTLGSLTMRTNSSSDMRKSMMEDMPMVSSKVEGPDGKKIDGFLYRYRKGGEGVRIVCVCHGNFLTPAEFVKHAGGGDVSNPLRHIVVNPSPSAFM